MTKEFPANPNPQLTPSPKTKQFLPLIYKNDKKFIKNENYNISNTPKYQIPQIPQILNNSLIISQSQLPENMLMIRCSGILLFMWAHFVNFLIISYFLYSVFLFFISMIFAKDRAALKNMKTRFVSECLQDHKVQRNCGKNVFNFRNVNRKKCTLASNTFSDNLNILTYDSKQQVPASLKINFKQSKTPIFPASTRRLSKCRSLSRKDRPSFQDIQKRRVMSRFEVGNQLVCGQQQLHPQYTKKKQKMMRVNSQADMHHMGKQTFQNARILQQLQTKNILEEKEKDGENNKENMEILENVNLKDTKQKKDNDKIYILVINKRESKHIAKSSMENVQLNIIIEKGENTKILINSERIVENKQNGPIASHSHRNILLNVERINSSSKVYERTEQNADHHPSTKIEKNKTETKNQYHFMVTEISEDHYNHHHTQNRSNNQQIDKNAQNNEEADRNQQKYDHQNSQQDNKKENKLNNSCLQHAQNNDNAGNMENAVNAVNNEKQKNIGEVDKMESFMQQQNIEEKEQVKVKLIVKEEEPAQNKKSTQKNWMISEKQENNCKDKIILGKSDIQEDKQYKEDNTRIQQNIKYEQKSKQNTKNKENQENQGNKNNKNHSKYSDVQQATQQQNVQDGSQQNVRHQKTSVKPPTQLYKKNDNKQDQSATEKIIKKENIAIQQRLQRKNSIKKKQRNQKQTRQTWQHKRSIPQKASTSQKPQKANRQNRKSEILYKTDTLLQNYIHSTGNLQNFKKIHLMKMKTDQPEKLRNQDEIKITGAKAPTAEIVQFFQCQRPLGRQHKQNQSKSDGWGKNRFKIIIETEDNDSNVDHEHTTRFYFQ